MAKSTKVHAADRAEASLEDILLSQGFGPRRDAHTLALSGAVTLRRPQTITGDAGPADEVCDDPDALLDPRGLTLLIQGVAWPVCSSALVLLHKPVGFECSRKPTVWPSVLSLLPSPLRNRDLQPVGRLDQDTTGLLLLTDDGALIHRLTSPKHHVPKVYQVTTKHPVDERQIDHLLKGVMLDDEPSAVRAAACVRTGECTLDLTLTEGKYHQVKRMVAGVGNRVEGLHRSTFGGLTLPADLPPGRWRWLKDVDRLAIG